MRSGSCFLLVVLSMFFNINCGDSNLKPVAKVGGRQISTADFIESFGQGKPVDAVNSAGDSVKQVYLNTMIDQELELVEAENLGFDQDEALVEEYKKAAKDMCANQVWNIDMIGHFAPEEDIRATYEKMKRQVRFSEIVFTFVKNDSVDTEPDVREMAKNIHVYLKKGAAFDSLARRFSHDKRVAKKGGDRGFLKWDARKADSPLYQKVWSMKPGRISKPFKSENKYYIVQVTEERPVQAGTYEQEKPRIQHMLMSQHQMEFGSRREEVIGDIEKKYGSEYNEETINYFLLKIQEKYAGMDSMSQGQARQVDYLDGFTPEDTAKALYSFDGNNALTIGTFVRILSPIANMRRPQLRTEKNLRDVLDQIKIYELLSYEGKRRGYLKLPKIQSDLKKLKEKKMLQNLRKKMNEELPQPTEAELFEYFEQNRDTYQHPARREVQEIWIKNKSVADKAMAAIKAGERFSNAARKYNERENTQRRNGYLGLIRKQEYGVIGIAAFSMKKEEVSEILNNGKYFSIIKVLDIRPAEPQTFEEAQKSVKSDLEEKYQKNATDELLERVKAENPIKVYSNRLHATVLSE